MKRISIDQWSTQAHYLTGITLLCFCILVVAVTLPGVVVSSADATEENVATQDELSENITITVTDSKGDTATAGVPIKIVEDNLARFDTDGEAGIQQGEALAAITAYNQGTLIGGEEVSQGDALEVISAYNTN